MIADIEKNNPDVICEWLAEFFLPRLYTKVKQDGHASLNDFIFQLSVKKNGSNFIGNEFVSEYIWDISNYMNTCVNYVEWLYYLIWLFNQFRPILTTLFITLFLLPVFAALLIYFSSTFLFISKHWSKLKVNYTIIWTILSPSNLKIKIKEKFREFEFWSQMTMLFKSTHSFLMIFEKPGLHKFYSIYFTFT